MFVICLYMLKILYEVMKNDETKKTALMQHNNRLGACFSSVVIMTYAGLGFLRKRDVYNRIVMFLNRIEILLAR